MSSECGRAFVIDRDALPFSPWSAGVPARWAAQVVDLAIMILWSAVNTDADSRPLSVCRPQ
jgi:hypothetical protein